MRLDTYVSVIFIISYCHAYSQNGMNHTVQKRDEITDNLNEGEICDEVDGLVWKCAPIKRCSISFISSLQTTKARLCKFSGPSPIFCCPSSNGRPHQSVTKPSTSKTTVRVVQQWTRPLPPATTKKTTTTTTTTTTMKTTTTTTTTTPSTTTAREEDLVSRNPIVLPLINEQNRTMRISERKCLEYAKAVFQESFITSLLISDERPEMRNTCKIRQLPLIVGGENAESKEFPHQALLGYTRPSSNTIAWGCGGILISEKYILTAAHCGNTALGPPKVALLGEVNFESTYEDAKFPLGKVTFHPDYFKSRPYNDIALVATTREVVFDDYVRPACLNTPDPIFPLLYKKDSVLATGWGLTENGGSQSKDLQKVRLSIVSKEKCDEFYNLQNGIDDERQLCAGDLKRRKDTCSGDSGGPLQAILKEPYCMYTIIGVTSIGLRNGCGTYKASVFTRVSHYLPWIERIVWPGL